MKKAEKEEKGNSSTNLAGNVLISPIKEMEIRSAKVPAVVSLAQGIPNFDTPECIKRKAIEAIQEGLVARYSLSPGIFELREAIEHDLAKRNIFYDFEEEIIVTAGSIEAISATLLALLEPGDEVLIPDPTYTSYQSAIKTARAIPVFFPLKEEKGWGFEVEQLEKRITPQTRAILFCNPNNPTGTIFSQSQLLKIAELAEEKNLFVISDEVYRDFIFDSEKYYSIAQFSSFRKNLIHIFSFSKAYAMTGWRVAYLAADKELAQRILGVHDALVTCAPVVSQWGALAALELGQEEVEKFKSEFDRRRRLICEQLDKMADWFSYETPSSAYFVFPKFSPKLMELIEKKILKRKKQDYEIKDYQRNSFSWRFALDLLYQGKVAVVPGVAFGSQGENHIRLCFGRKSSNILEAMMRIKKYLKKIENKKND